MTGIKKKLNNLKMFYRMMKMTGRVSCCCVALLCVVASVSAVEWLNSFDDLRRVGFGQSVPAHSLVLLFWFAHTVDIDNTNVIRLTFDPQSDYGSHHFGNYDSLLGTPPYGYKYFTVGNLHRETSDELPDYVVNTRHPYRSDNRDRIVFRARGQSVDQVYITQHSGKPYDPDHTYQITTNLLRQIREFPMTGNAQTLQFLRSRYQSNADIPSVRNTWGNLAGLGLFLFIVGERRLYFQEQSSRLPGRQNNEWNWNTGSAANYTSTSQNDVTGLLCALFFIIIIICFFLFCAVKIPKV